MKEVLKNNETLLENRPQVNNPYGQDILGNTEIDLELHQVQGERSSQRMQNLNLNPGGALDQSVNSPRLVHHETETPQNFVTQIANTEMRPPQLILNTENREDSGIDSNQDNLNMNNFYENLSTERGNDLINNGTFMNNSNANLLNNTLDQKCSQPQAQPQNVPKVPSVDTSSLKSISCVCKICLSEEEDPHLDPLISPCKCTGTVKYMHVSCLKEWIKAKCKISEKDYCKTYIWENLFCELCKVKYPDFIQKKRKIPLVEFEIPEEDDYLLLESFQRHEEKRIRVLHVLRFTKDLKKINIGRANKCEARIIDISVSRLHSQIRMEKDGFWILDSNSKFGTLLGSNKPEILKVNEPQYVQVGRSLLIVMVEKPWCKCCISCMVPGEIEQGNEFGLSSHRFPKECRELYEESLENLIPISESLKKGRKADKAEKEKQKVIPINQELGERNLNSEMKDGGPPTEGNVNQTPRNGFSNNPTTQDQTEMRGMKSRNRSRYDLTKPIIEHEEEAKGTIDFKNRPALREESKERPFGSYRVGMGDPLNESNQPFIKESNEEYKLNEGEDNSIENALRMINHAEGQEMKLIPSQEEGNDEEEKMEESKDLSSHNSGGLNDRKRSISAQEPTRNLRLEGSRSQRNKISIKNNLQIKKNNLIERRKMEVAIGIQSQAEIDELINDFSQDLERREEGQN